MTGKDLIVYILMNNLEHVKVESILDSAFLSECQVAKKFDVGVETIRAWERLKLIQGISFNGIMYYLNDISDPRTKKV